MGKYRTLILNVGLFALNSLATKLISFLLVPLYTAYMTAGDYGLTDMANTVISLILPLITLDMADAAVRYIVEDEQNEGKYAAVAFFVTALSVLIMALLTPLLDLGAFGGLGSYKQWFVLAYTTVAFMTLCGEVARGSGEVRLIPICAAVSSILTLVCAFVFIAWMGFGIVGYFISVSIGPIFAICIYLTVGGLGRMAISGYRKIFNEGIESVRSVFLLMARYALPLIPNSLFWWAGTSINRLFITGMLGISASGMFAAAGKVPGLINTTYGIFQQAWQLSAFQEAKNEGLNIFYSTVFRVLSAGLAILCSCLSFLSPLLALLLLRGETYEAWTMIPILLIANLLNVFNSFYGTIYTSTMHTNYIMKTTVFGAISCVIFTPLLIPIMGTFGACIASAVGQGVVLIMRALDSKKYIEFDAGWSLLVPTFILIAIQAVVAATQVNGWTVISMGCFLAVFVMQGYRVRIIAKKIMKSILN